eukprot:g59090.t1
MSLLLTLCVSRESACLFRASSCQRVLSLAVWKGGASKRRQMGVKRTVVPGEESEETEDKEEYDWRVKVEFRTLDL